MTTPLVLLGLALLSGAIVWVLSVRQPGTPVRRPTISREREMEPLEDIEDIEDIEDVEQIEALDLGTPATEPEPLPARGAADSFAYVPLAISDGLNLRTRLFGILGLVAVIVLTSAAVAFGLWMLGRGIGLQLSNFVKR
jgi:hypothetical protein